MTKDAIYYLCAQTDQSIFYGLGPVGFMNSICKARICPSARGEVLDVVIVSLGALFGFLSQLSSCASAVSMCSMEALSVSWARFFKTNNVVS